MSRRWKLLTDDITTRLNAQVDIDKHEVATVAKTFLIAKGLVKQ